MPQNQISLILQAIWSAMEFEKVKGLNDEQFRRRSGTKRTTFDKRVSILSEGRRVKKIKGGRKSKLSVEDMLLMTLEYLREYRTYFHIRRSYNISIVALIRV